MKASFQRVDLFGFVELRSPVKPGMTCGTDMTMLFSDAEISKNIAQNFVRGYLADNAAEVVDGFADVLRSEVGREADGEAFLDAEEGSAGVSEGLGVSLVCDEGGVAVAEHVALSEGQICSESGDSEAGFS